MGKSSPYGGKIFFSAATGAWALNRTRMRCAHTYRRTRSRKRCPARSWARSWARWIRCSRISPPEKRGQLQRKRTDQPERLSPPGPAGAAPGRSRCSAPSADHHQQPATRRTASARGAPPPRYTAARCAWRRRVASAITRPPRPRMQPLRGCSYRARARSRTRTRDAGARPRVL